MRVIIKRISGKIDRATVDPIVAKNQFNPYHHIGFHNLSSLFGDYYYKLFFKEQKNKIFSATVNGEIRGLMVLSIPEWDQRVFGIKMSRIEYLTATGDYAEQLAIKCRFLKEAVKHLKESKVAHISVRIESNDFSAIHALECHGFRIMDNLLTYILNDRKSSFPQAGSWFSIKEIAREDFEEAGNLLADKCVLGHYTVDPAIPLLKVKNMYKQWLENNWNDLKNNDIFVARRSGQIVGCSFFSFNSLLQECTGLNSLYRGLIAVKPLAAGCFFAFLKAHTRKRRKLDFAEFETQTYNYTMMKLIQNLGMRLIRSRYTFHKRL